MNEQERCPRCMHADHDEGDCKTPSQYGCNECGPSRGTPEYITVPRLHELSHAEREEYMDSLVEAGMDDGPEWDRLYTAWEERNDF